MRRLCILLMFASACGRFGFSEQLAGGAAADADTDSDGSGPPPNRAFVTSAMYPATFGGVSAANAACQQAADSAQLGGTFVALLGAGAQTAMSVVAGARGWVDTAGRVIIDQPTEWFDGTMRRPLLFDENGTNVGYSLVWLGANGTDACGDWTSTAGNGGIATTTNYFTMYSVSQCAGTARIACVETARSIALQDPIVAGMVVFVTSTTWIPAGGLTAADTVCQTDATSHGFTGAFLAALNTTTIARFQRITDPVATFVNARGIPIVPAGTDVSTVAVLDAFLVRSDSMPAPSAPAGWAWSGHTADNNCTDWTATGGLGVTGDGSSADLAQINERFAYACTTDHPLICFQN